MGDSQIGTQTPATTTGHKAKTTIHILRLNSLDINELIGEQETTRFSSLKYISQFHNFVRQWSYVFCHFNLVGSILTEVKKLYPNLHEGSVDLNLVGLRKVIFALDPRQ